MKYLKHPAGHVLALTEAEFDPVAKGLEAVYKARPEEVGEAEYLASQPPPEPPAAPAPDLLALQRQADEGAAALATLGNIRAALRGEITEADPGSAEEVRAILELQAKLAAIEAELKAARKK